MAPPNFLVVSSSTELQQEFTGLLRKCGLAPIVASTGGQAEEVLGRCSVSVVFCSDELSNEELDRLIQQTLRASQRVPLIVVSRFHDLERVPSLLHRGVLDIVLYPLSEIEIERVVRNALGFARLTETQQRAILGTPLASGTVEVPRFDREALVAALRTDQTGQSTFPGFLLASWRAGVVRYDVDLNARTCTYYGANGEEYIETYPSIDVG